MNIHALKEYIKKDESLIELILESAGFHKVNGQFNHGKEFRCAWEDGGNPTSVKVNKDTLSANCYSRGIKGDIITLVQEKQHLQLRDALHKIASITKFTDEEIKPVNVPFGGFYKAIRKSKKREVEDIETLDESILDNYLIMPSQRFLKDGISYEVQQRYGIGYDVVTGRIVVPWRSLSGELVGVMGRLNKEDISEHENKWFPILKFPKSKTLFGFSENYQSIQKESFVMLGESEKFPQRLSTLGIDLGLGLGGSSISQFQSNNIKSLFPKKVLVCMDEGLDEQISIDISNQLKVDTIFKNEVHYIYDKENKYLPKGSKMSPSDLSLSNLKKLIMECSVKV